MECADMLAKLAEQLNEPLEIRVGENGCVRLSDRQEEARNKAHRIIAELAKVKLVNGTYGAVAVLSETETDELFQKILAITEGGATNG